MPGDNTGERRIPIRPLGTWWLHRFRERLLGWYAQHARRLPWRQSNDPYHVWVSEIMLQQTQVATVERYFTRFIAVLPTIQALAEADPQQVLRLWEGLGYYRRARQIHLAAREIVERHGGEMPRDVQNVRSLPGIGRYTAGAILSIAFDAREPIVEANSRRVLIRVAGYRGDPSTAAEARWLWRAATKLVPHRHAGIFNQALMELGSLVCTLRAPACFRCPVAALCVARAEQLQEVLPRPSRKPPAEKVHEAAMVIYRGGKILLMQRGSGQRWAGLWDFPRFPFRPRRSQCQARALVAPVKKLTGITVKPGAHLLTIRHGVTRFRITLDCFAATYVSARPVATQRNRMIWATPAELERYPLNASARKLARFLPQDPA